MIGIFDFTSLFTFLGTMCGLFSIYFSFQGNLGLAMILLVLASFVDSMDGFVARLKKNRTEFEKKYGVQLDSLSDVVCFGVAPLFLAFHVNDGNMILQGLSFLYFFAAISRFTWFNVEEEERRKKESGSRKYYTGLPVTPSSLILGTIFLLRDVLGNIFPYLYTAILLCVAFLQLSKLQVPHMQKKGQTICVIYGLLLLILLILYSL